MTQVGVYAQYEILKAEICILRAYRLNISGCIIIISYIKKQVKKMQKSNIALYFQNDMFLNSKIQKSILFFILL